MRAIETRYKGYRFRSRLEARWAVFFDALGLKWSYETEGFELADGTRYLPDFFIQHYKAPSIGYWLEIKGPEPTTEDLDALQRLANESGHHAYLLRGDPADFEYWFAALHIETVHGGKQYGVLSNIAPFICCPAAAPTPDTLLRAAISARGARFEFGEVPT
jgi:hypothetical protein